MRFRVATVCLLFSLCSFAQQTTEVAAASERITVPHLIRISGQMPSANGTIGVTFALYRSQTDTVPLWTETQNVAADASGKYNVLIGATKEEGIPLELFANGEAQWLGIRREGQAEQPRILLVSVPYSMKAAEAETLSGHKAEEFVTQQNLGEMVQLKLQEPEIRMALANPFVTANTATTSGATNFTDSTTNQIIAVTQNGAGRLITGLGPSHTQVFAVDETGVIHGTGLALDGSAGRTIGMGNNATPGGGGYQLTVRAGESASGSTNKRGGELQLAAGPGTGTGGSGDVVIETAPPGANGTTVGTLLARDIYASAPVSMGGASGFATLAEMQIPPNGSGAFQVHFTITATDDSAHFLAASGECVLVTSYASDGGSSAVAKLGADYEEDALGDDKANANCEAGLGSGISLLSVADSLTFTPTVHTISYQVVNVSQWPIVLYANAASAEKGPLPKMPGGARTSREHPSVMVRRDADGTVTVLDGPTDR